MKRLFGLSLALCLIGGFAGCDKKAEVKKDVPAAGADAPKTDAPADAAPADAAPAAK